jgi:hypothetical protein
VTPQKNRSFSSTLVRSPHGWRPSREALLGRRRSLNLLRKKRYKTHIPAADILQVEA